MKSTLRFIVAAAALVAGSAFAQNTPVPTAATGSDLFFYAYDSLAGTSYVMDLGSSLTAFPASTAATSGQAWSILSTNSQFAAYEAATLSAESSYTSALQNTQWGVIAGQTGSFKNVDVTVGSGVTANNETSGNLSKVVGAVANLTSAVNGLNQGSITAAQLQAGYFTVATDFTNTGVSISPINTYLNFNSVSNVGQSANFVTYGYNSTPSSVHAASVFGGAATPSTFSFDGSNLTYAVAQVAAVPEPSSYAMMLAGLLMVGAMVARRRDSK